MFIPLAIVAITVLAFWLMASWTADEVGYVLSLLMGHHVVLNTLEGFALNVVLNGIIGSFDVVVWVLRTIGAI